MDNLCDHHQIYPSITILSIVASLSWWPEVSWAPWAINNSPWCCQPRSTWATYWLFWCSAVARLWHLSIYVILLPSQVLHSGSNILPKCSSPGGFSPALPVTLLPPLQPPPQGICHHSWISREVKYWPFSPFNNIESQLDGFHLCKLTGLTFSFSSFYNFS